MTEGRAAAPPDFKVLRLARYSVPVHLALPFVLWQIGRQSPDAAAWFLLGLHALFLVVIPASYVWWRGYGVQLAALIVIDHAATFASGIALLVWLG